MGYDPSGNVDYMNPMDIRFSQDTISSHFRAKGRYRHGKGKPVSWTINDLKYKKLLLSR